MGRRKKSSTKKISKKKPTLSTVFTCPSCNNEKVVECSMDFKSGIGELECRICGAHFNTSIHRLSKPIDVYCDWIDECERLNRGEDNSDFEDDEDEFDDEDDAEDNIYDRQRRGTGAGMGSNDRGRAPEDKDSDNDDSSDSLSLPGAPSNKRAKLNDVDDNEGKGGKKADIGLDDAEEEEENEEEEEEEEEGEEELIGGKNLNSKEVEKNPDSVQLDATADANSKKRKRAIESDEDSSEEEGENDLDD